MPERGEHQVAGAADDLAQRHPLHLLPVDAGEGGARFEVRLPIAEPTVEVPREKVCAPQCGRLRLLLVDDEVNLLRTYAQSTAPPSIH